MKLYRKEAKILFAVYSDVGFVPEVNSKDMKRFISILLVLVLCMANSVFAAQNDFSTQPDGWDVSSYPKGSSGVVWNDDNMDLYFDTTGAESRGNAYVTPPGVNAEDGRIYIEFTSEFSGGETIVNRAVYMFDKDYNGIDIISISDGNLYVDGNEIYTGMQADTRYRIGCAIELNEQTAYVWVDDQMLGTAALNDDVLNMDLSNISLEFGNYMSSKNEIEAHWKIGGLIFEKISDDINIITSPEDGDSMVSADTKEITVTYDGAVGMSTLKEDNYELYKDGEPVEITVKRQAGTVSILPVDGLEANCDYEVKIKVITSVLDSVIESDRTFSFRAAEDGYQQPEISFLTSDTSIKEGQSVELRVSAQSPYGIDKVIYYNNGELLEEVSSGEDYLYTFKPAAGKNIIEAVAVDTKGGKSKTVQITVNCEINTPPVLSVEGITDNMTVTGESIPSVKVQATDDTEVVSIKVYLDGRLIHQTDGASAEFSIDNLITGTRTVKIVATDDNGAETSNVYNITVESELMRVVTYEDDFSKYSSTGSTFPSGDWYGVMNGSGTLLSEEIDKEHGTSLTFSTANDKNSQGSWLKFATMNANKKFEIQMDIYFFNKNADFRFMQRQTTPSVVTYDLIFTPYGLRLRNGSETVTVNYDAQKWYQMRYIVDLQTHTYDLYLNDEKVADNFGMESTSVTNIDTRLEVYMGENYDAKVGLDNVKIIFYEEAPVITSVGSDGNFGSNKVSIDASTINAKVSSALNPTTVNAQNVKLYTGDEEVETESISYNEEQQTIDIALAEKVRSGTTYTITLSSEVQTTLGVAVAKDYYYDFDSDFAPFDVKSSRVQKTGGAISASLDIQNTTGNSKSFYVIVAVYDGTQMTGISVNNVTMGANEEKTVTTKSINDRGGDTVEIYVVDSLTNPKSSISQILRHTI